MRERLALLRLGDAREELVAVVLEAKAIDLLDRRVAARRASSVMSRDRLVELREDVARDVLHVAREHQAVVRAPDVHADLLAVLLEVPLVDADAAPRRPS